MARLRTRNRSALAAATLLTVALAAGLSGCAAAEEDPLRVPTKTTAQTPEPTVTLTPIPSSSTTPGEDPEADVAAAIAAYEEYVSAMNNIVVADESTWTRLLDATAGEHLTGTKDALDAMKAEGTTLSGESTVLATEVVGADADRVVFDVCLDVSDTHVLGSDGVDLDPSRDPISKLRVRAVPSVATAVWKVDYVVNRKDGLSC